MVAQYQHPVAHAVGQHETVVVDRQLVKNGIFGNHVIIVAGAQPRRVGLAQLGEVGHVVAVVITDIRYRQPLLEQPLAAVEVVEEHRRARPPGHVRVQVGAGEVLLPRHSHFLGRADERVPDQQVQALAAGVVERRLEVVPQGFLPVRADGGEAFGGDQFAAVGVGGGSRLLDEEAVFVADAVLPRPGPELRHGHLVHAEATLRVDRRGMGAARLRVGLQARLRRVRHERLVVVGDRQVAEGLPEIVEEAVGGLAIVDDAARQRRQERQEIVAAALPELGAQGGRPVDGLDFPTVGVEVLQDLAGQRSRIRDQWRHHGIPVALERAPVEHVERVAGPAVARGRDARVVANGAAETQHLPAPWRRRPTQHAGFVQLAC